MENHETEAENRSEKEESKPVDWLNFDPIPEVDRLFRFTCNMPKLHGRVMSNYGDMFLNRSDLSPSARHYIGLIAASRHRCLSLIDLHRRRFLEKGGQQIWLLGIDWAMMRYRKLDYLNRLLCHRPWTVHWKNLAVLFPRGSPDGNTSFFSVAAVNHAVGIMAMTHAMCTVVCCIGLERRSNLTQDEIDFLNVDDQNYWEMRMDKFFRKAKDRDPTEVEQLIREMRKSEKGSQRPPSKMCISTRETVDSLIRAPAATYSSNRKNYSPVLLMGSRNQQGEDLLEKEPPCDYPIYSHDRTFGYIDFRKRPEKDIQPLRVEEFGWDHAYNAMNQYSNMLTSRMDNMFDQIRSNTDNLPSQSSEQHEIDTKSFREAVWNYTQGLYGIRVDDYDYSKINRVLDKGTKTFIKLAACYPHKLTTEITRALPGFRDSEKIQVVMLVAMARFQATMFHYTRAVSNFNAMSYSKHGWRRPLD